MRLRKTRAKTSLGELPLMGAAAWNNRKPPLEQQKLRWSPSKRQPCLSKLLCLWHPTNPVPSTPRRKPQTPLKRFQNWMDGRRVDVEPIKVIPPLWCSFCWQGRKTTYCTSTASSPCSPGMAINADGAVGKLCSFHRENLASADPATPARVEHSDSSRISRT